MSEPKIVHKKASAQLQFGLEEIWNEVNALPRLSPFQVIKYYIVDAVRSILNAPLTFFVTTLTVSLTLFLLASLLLVTTNIKSLVKFPNQSLPLRIFFTETATTDAQRSFLSELTNLSDVESVSYVSKKQALEEFRITLGEQGTLLSGLDENNPLPASLVVYAKGSADKRELFQKIHDTYIADSNVEYIEFQSGVIEKIQQFIDLLWRLGIAAIVCALFLAAGIIMSAIRLAVYAQRTEIQIMNLVGATDRFVRFPFLIEGLLQGFLGAVLSLVLLYLSYSFFSDFFIRSGLFESFAQNASFLSIFLQLFVVVAGTAIGLFGSFLAVRKYEQGLI